MTTTKIRKLGGAAGLVAAGLVAGGVLAGTVAAGADTTTTPSNTASSSASSSDDAGRPAETALTGDKLAKVKAAVTKAYPNATFVRVETDSDGVYEAHITKADGTEVTVEVDAGYAVTGEEADHGGPGRGGHGGGAGETALTGDTLAKVKAAVTKAYPNATFVRVETDSDGVYEAHITKADGTEVTVEVDKSFGVTGDE